MRGLRMRKNENGGYSLIELIVIIAIVSVLIAFIGYNIAVTNSFRARECAKDISTDLASLKVTTLSKSALIPGASGYPDVYVEIYKSGNEVYRKLSVKGETDVKRLAKRVTVKYGQKGSTMQEIGAEGAGGLKLAFNRSTGALAMPSVGGNVINCIEVYVEESKKYTIDLVPATGKVVYKQRN